MAGTIGKTSLQGNLVFYPGICLPLPILQSLVPMYPYKINNPATPRSSALTLMWLLPTIAVKKPFPSTDATRPVRSMAQ